jgi:hypothetical protein
MNAEMSLHRAGYKSILNEAVDSKGQSAGGGVKWAREPNLARQCFQSACGNTLRLHQIY